MRIFLDANIIFSALTFDGSVRRLLTLLVNAGCELVADEYVIGEAQRNVELKYQASPDLNEEISSLFQISPVVQPAILLADVELMEKDRPVLASAIALRCDALVTGDKTHFGHLFGICIGGVHIHSPQTLADLLLLN